MNRSLPLEVTLPSVGLHAKEHARRGLELALCLFCAALPLSIAGANLAWGAVLLALAWHALAGGGLRYGAVRSAALFPLLAYLGASVVTAMAGIDPAHSARYLYQDFHKVWLYCLFMAALSAEPASRALAALAAGFSAASLIGIFQAASSWALPAGEQVRAHAFVHPATFGEQLCVAALGGAAFLLKPETRTGRKAAGVFLALAFTALFLSNTKGAALALAAGLFAILAVQPSYRRRALIGLALGLAAFVAMDLARMDRSILAEALGLRSPGLAHRGQFMRLTLWDVAWRMGWDHPWTGVGLNNYRQAFGAYFTGVMEDGRTNWGTAHNLYLHHFAERGLLGVAALGWLLWSFSRRAWERARARPDAWNLWALGTTAAFLAMNLTEVALQTEVVWMLVFFVWVWAEARHKAAA